MTEAQQLAERIAYAVYEAADDEKPWELPVKQAAAIIATELEPVLAENSELRAADTTNIREQARLIEERDAAVAEAEELRGVLDRWQKWWSGPAAYYGLHQLPIIPPITDTAAALAREGSDAG